MKNVRYLKKWITNFCFPAKKMAFISGPRQAGKTTFAKQLLKKRINLGVYYNWDETTFRRIWTKNPARSLPKIPKGKKTLVIFDELHKAKLWKRNLKGLYDT